MDSLLFYMVIVAEAELLIQWQTSRPFFPKLINYGQEYVSPRPLTGNVYNMNGRQRTQIIYISRRAHIQKKYYRKHEHIYSQRTNK